MFMQIYKIIKITKMLLLHLPKRAFIFFIIINLQNQSLFIIIINSIWLVIIIIYNYIFIVSRKNGLYPPSNFRVCAPMNKETRNNWCWDYIYISYTIKEMSMLTIGWLLACKTELHCRKVELYFDCVVFYK